MSYTITVTVDTDGTRVATSGTVMPGEYTIAGHIDDKREDISAQRIGAGRQLKSRASTTVYREV